MINCLVYHRIVYLEICKKARNIRLRIVNIRRKKLPIYSEHVGINENKEVHLLRCLTS